MPRFFVDPGSIGRDEIIVVGDDARHISRSLRMKENEHLTVCDGCGTDFECVIRSFGNDEVVLAIKSTSCSVSEPPYRAEVYQALVRGERFDTVIQKSVECGASRIIPYSSSRCTVKLDPKDAARKQARWQKIATEAAKQCGRGVIPEVAAPVDFSTALSSASEAELSFMCYECSRVPLKRRLEGFVGDMPRIAIMIGPEGGFSPEEASRASSAGILDVSLGTRILRTESAAPFVLACLSYVFEE